jgi:ankyrin repeat protein
MRSSEHSLEIVQMLLQNGAKMDLERRTYTRKTGSSYHSALEDAIRNRNLEIAEFLIENGAEGDLIDRFNLFCLRYFF